VKEVIRELSPLKREDDQRFSKGNFDLGEKRLGERSPVAILGRKRKLKNETETGQFLKRGMLGGVLEIF